MCKHAVSQVVWAARASWVRLAQIVSRLITPVRIVLPLTLALAIGPIWGTPGNAEAEEAKDAKTKASIPLEDAVGTFNTWSKESLTGRHESPLAVSEILDALARAPGLRELSEEDRATLQSIRQSRELPPDVTLRAVSRYDDGHQFQHVWWVRLLIVRDSGSVRTIPIRQKTIFSRPYTQKEREFKESSFQHGIPFLNRLSAYFPDDPRFGVTSSIPEDKASELIVATQRALADKNLEGLLDLYNWEGVSQSTRDFVRREMQQILGSTIASVKVLPREFGGRLENWKAFRTYDPNLPVIGYLVLTTAGDEQHPATSLSFEIGENEGRLRLVNYSMLTDGLKAGRVLEMSSSRAHIEQLSDGSSEFSFTNESPASLISARLANEEVWRIEDLSVFAPVDW